MSYPTRCAHNVIRCDECEKVAKPSEAALATARATIKKLDGENVMLRDRVRDLERNLADVGETHYDLKQQLRSLETLNEELRLVQSRGRR